MTKTEIRIRITNSRIDGLVGDCEIIDKRSIEFVPNDAFLEYRGK